MVGPALRFLAVGALLAVPGIVLIVIGSDGWLGLGIALIFLASCPAVMPFSSAITRTASTNSRFLAKLSPWKRG